MENEHIILFDNEPGMSELEQSLLDDLQNIRKTPTVLHRATETMFFSFGGGVNGVNMANHGFTWIGLIVGRKLWHVAPGTIPKPREPNCARKLVENEVLPNTTHCLQEAGDIIALPTAWWHATCNLDPFTIGIGGQDSCDLGCVQEAKQNPNTPFCQNVAKHYKCWGVNNRDELYNMCFPG